MPRAACLPLLTCISFARHRLAAGAYNKRFARTHILLRLSLARFCITARAVGIECLRWINQIFRCARRLRRICCARQFRTSATARVFGSPARFIGFGFTWMPASFLRSWRQPALLRGQSPKWLDRVIKGRRTWRASQAARRQITNGW